ncbi:hypothetical protein ACFZDG_01435 [Kitasatospora xanthocidica]|uniref:hypothetical protein n=1 Tax=Kitasatospora xanthocidica TaxID=83382 RepID=UPI0036ED91A9
MTDVTGTTGTTGGTGLGGAAGELVDPARLAALDWSDMPALHAPMERLLEDLVSSPTWLNDAIDHVLDTPELLAQCETLQELDRIVLVNDKATDVRIRLHVFTRSAFERPHNHRWSFGSRILHGSYQHDLFGDYDELSTDTRIGSPALVRQETAGSGYVIRHTMVHTVRAVPETTSLIVRGPSEKDRFVVMNRDSGEAWWQYGQKAEKAEEQRARQLGAARVNEIRELLKRQGVIG